MASSEVNNLLKDVTIKGVKPLRNELGSGAYGRVFTVEYRGVVCAAKEIHSILIENVTPVEKRAIIDKFVRECHHCSTINHPNIVHFLGVYYASKRSELPIMVMELMDTNLTSFVEDNQSKILMSAKLSILYDVSLGLSYLHARTPVVVHRDLSSNNVMLSTRGQLVAKIGDLGVAKAIPADSEQTRSVLTIAPGTVDFMPPESLVAEPIYGTAVDVFSFAGIGLHVFAEKWPEPCGEKRRDLVTKRLVALNEVERRQEYLDKIPEGAVILRELFERCLDYEPNERPHIQEVSEMIELLKTNLPAIQNPTRQFEGESSEPKKINSSIHDVANQFSGAKLSEPKREFAEALQSNQYHIKWTSCRNLPQKLYNASVAVSPNGNTVYVTAGTAPNHSIYNNVYCYNRSINKWSVLPRPGHCRGVLQILDNRLTIFGGEDPDTCEIIDKVTTYNSDANRWYSCYPNMQNRRYLPGVVTYHNYAIVMGGQHSPAGFYDNIEVLDFHSNCMQWQEVAVRLPAPMWNFKPAISSDKITIVGFSTNGGRDIRYFQIAVEKIIGSRPGFAQWKELPYPAHWETTTVPHTNPPVIIGGRDARHIATSGVALYDTLRNSWRKVGSLTRARNFVGIGLLDASTIIVIGGCTDGSTIQASKATSLATVEIGNIVAN